MKNLYLSVHLSEHSICSIKTSQSSLVRLVTACQLYCHNLIQERQGFMQSYKDKKQDFTQEGA